MNLALADVQGGWWDESETPTAPRIKRIECRSQICRVWHDPRPHLDGYCSRTCAREDRSDAGRVRREGRPTTSAYRDRSQMTDAEIADVRQAYRLGTSLRALGARYRISATAAWQLTRGVRRGRAA